MSTDRATARDRRKWSTGTALAAFLLVLGFEAVAFFTAAAVDSDMWWLAFYWVIPVVAVVAFVLVRAGHPRVGWGLLVGTAAAFVGVALAMIALIAYLMSVGAFV